MRLLADAPAVSDFTQGADNGLKFIDMRLVEWNDDEQWDAFLDQLTVADMTALMPDTFGVAGLDKVGMPAQKRADDCLGVGSTMIATGDNCLSWVSEVMTARTWNRDRMERKGSLMAIPGRLRRRQRSLVRRRQHAPYPVRRP